MIWEIITNCVFESIRDIWEDSDKNQNLYFMGEWTYYSGKPYSHCSGVNCQIHWLNCVILQLQYLIQDDRQDPKTQYLWGKYTKFIPELNMEKLICVSVTGTKCQNMCCYSMASSVIVPHWLFEKWKCKVPGSWNDWFILTDKHIWISCP